LVESLKIVGIDLGGHGAAAALVEIGDNGAKVRSERFDWQPSSTVELAQLAIKTFGHFDGLGLSTAGYVKYGNVTLCRAQPWVQGNTVAELLKALPQRSKVAVLNDGEAHTIAAIFGKDPRDSHPLLSFGIGTSVSFGRTSDQGEIERPLSMRNWDIGSMRVRSRCSHPEIWWACGSNGLAELESSMSPDQALQHFGARLGALVADFTILFQPRTVVLSGGIPDRHGNKLLDPANAELSKILPDHVQMPRLEKSLWGRNAGIVGGALAVAAAARGIPN